jgi:hypothetical protein
VDKRINLHFDGVLDSLKIERFITNKKFHLEVGMMCEKEALDYLCRHSKNARSIDMSDCVISTRVVRTLVANFPKLREVIFQADVLTPELRAQLRDLPHLRRIRVRDRYIAASFQALSCHQTRHTELDH